ncbi:MAG TPA: DNA polymerase [Oceanithermus sp.]|nr:DNA polymerase [Oceanithermus sp.]
MGVRYLFLDMNAYFASVEQQDDKTLRGKPVCVVPVEAETTVCIAASYEARRCGVKTGTPVYEARARCPGLRVVRARPRRYVEVHQQILRAVESVLPIEEVRSIDEMRFRLLKNERPHARELALALKEAIRTRVGEHLLASVGGGPNRFLAKVATEIEKPDGLVLITEEDLPEILWTLKLTDLYGIGRRMERRLNRLGVFTVRQLTEAPLELLRKAWGGVLGERMYRNLRGEDLPEVETHRRSFAHSHVLSPELRAPEKARLVAVRLLVKAAARMRKAGYAAGSLYLHLRFLEGEDYAAFTHLAPTFATRTLVFALRRLWPERERRPVLKASVTLGHLVAYPGLSLFSTERKNQLLAHALDQINARFGPDTVRPATLDLVGEVGEYRIAFDKIPDFSV